MAQTIEAVYENGVFKPVQPVKLQEGQRVQVYIPWGPGDLTPEQALEQMREVQKAFADWTDEDWAEFEQSWKRGK